METKAHGAFLAGREIRFSRPTFLRLNLKSLGQDVGLEFAPDLTNPYGSVLGIHHPTKCLGLQLLGTAPDSDGSAGLRGLGRGSTLVLTPLCPLQQRSPAAGSWAARRPRPTRGPIWRRCRWLADTCAAGSW